MAHRASIFGAGPPGGPVTPRQSQMPSNDPRQSMMAPGRLMPGRSLPARRGVAVLVCTVVL